MVTIRSAIPTLAWLVAGVLFCAQTAAAHGGRLNAQGCHNDRKNGG
ncbi:YHYH domain-containing protein, partial [Lysobacter maris]